MNEPTEPTFNEQDIEDGLMNDLPTDSRTPKKLISEKETVQRGLAPLGLLCRACGAPAGEVRNINLYVIGSEGLNVCHDCEMQIVEFCRSMIRTATKARMAGYRACKQVADAKQHNADIRRSGSTPEPTKKNGI